MNQCRPSGDKPRIIRMKKIKASESLLGWAVTLPLRIQGSHKCKVRENFSYGQPKGYPALKLRFAALHMGYM
jgi:hypothetical protein